MKKWRDFKLLALCAGLVLLDAGCKPTPLEEEEWDSAPIIGIGARVVGLEECQGTRYMVVAATARPPSTSPHKIELNLVAGEYRGRPYQRLFRLREDSRSGRSFMVVQVGDCIGLNFRFFRFYPPCFTDQLATYTLTMISLRPDAEAECAEITNPR